MLCSLIENEATACRSHVSPRTARTGLRLFIRAQAQVAARRNCRQLRTYRQPWKTLGAAVIAHHTWRDQSRCEAGTGLMAPSGNRPGSFQPRFDLACVSSERVLAPLRTMPPQENRIALEVDVCRTTARWRGDEAMIGVLSRTRDNDNATALAPTADVGLFSAAAGGDVPCKSGHRGTAATVAMTAQIARLGERFYRVAGK